MTDRIPFFDFFDRFVPPRELRLMLHDAAVTGGVLNRAERTMELEVETGEALPDAAVEAVRQLLMEEYRLRQLRMMVRTVQPGKKTKDILMGKPIKGKPIPMVELNPKMGAIVVPDLRYDRLQGQRHRPQIHGGGRGQAAGRRGEGRHVAAGAGHRGAESRRQGYPVHQDRDAGAPQG